MRNLAGLMRDSHGFDAGFIRGSRGSDAKSRGFHFGGFDGFFLGLCSRLVRFSEKLFMVNMEYVS